MEKLPDNCTHCGAAGDYWGQSRTVVERTELALFPGLFNDSVFMVVDYFCMKCEKYVFTEKCDDKEESNGS